MERSATMTSADFSIAKFPQLVLLYSTLNPLSELLSSIERQFHGKAITIYLARGSQLYSCAGYLLGPY